MRSCLPGHLASFKLEKADVVVRINTYDKHQTSSSVFLYASPERCWLVMCTFLSLWVEGSKTVEYGTLHTTFDTLDTKLIAKSVHYKSFSSKHIQPHETKRRVSHCYQQNHQNQSHNNEWRRCRSSGREHPSRAIAMRISKTDRANKLYAFPQRE